MRDAAIAIIREIGVETGGSNIQFAVHPADGRMVVIEMNPRVSRSSALASKATGFPIAKVAAKLAVGYTLDEIPNDITRETMASFEPAIDYCVVEVPPLGLREVSRCGPRSDHVHEIRGGGHGHRQDLQRGAAEGDPVAGDRPFRPGNGREGRGCRRRTIREKLGLPTPERIFHLRSALKSGISPGEIAELTGIDRWFLENMKADLRPRGGDQDIREQRPRSCGNPPGAAAPGQGVRVFGCAAGPPSGLR